MSNQITRLEYCQYLLVTQINYTLTNFADHSSKFSHDKINRFLKGEKITPRSIWDNQELAGGKTIKIKDWTKEHKVKLFRVEVSSQGHALSGLPTSVRCPHCHDKLRSKLRAKLGRKPQSTVASADSQSVKTTEKRGVVYGNEGWQESQRS